MSVHGRTPFCGAGAALQVLRHPGLKTLSLSVSLCPDFVSNLTPPRLCLLLFLSGQDSRRSVSKQSSPAAVGKSPGTTKNIHAVRMGGQGLQSQDRGTWARLRGKMSSVCLLAVDGQRGSSPFQRHGPPAFAGGICLPGAVWRRENDDLSVL